MKLKSLLATAFMTAALFASPLAFSQDANPPPPPPRACDLPGAEGCAPIGGNVCTANGCYQMQCNAAGCVLVFTPAGPRVWDKER
ncbi:hypothetical protein [Arenimonas alkanexedens]